MRNCLTDIAGLRVGHAHDAALRSGVSVVLFEPPAIAAASLLGGAPAVRDTALLALDNAVERIDAIVLSGGSVYGLDATAGVQAAWREDKWGRADAGLARQVNVPIVVQASLFDLTNGGDKEWGRIGPYQELGYRAARAATGLASPNGSHGAGFGASTADLRGGIGTASTRTADGHVVAAMVAVNAVGSATLPGGWFWAAPFEQAAEFGGLGWPSPLPADAGALRVKQPDAWGTSGLRGPSEGTVIGIVATDAALSPAQAQRLAITAQDGIARAVLPAHLARDGDVMFAASLGATPLGEARDAFTGLCLAATLVTARAVARGVYHADVSPGAGCPPSWTERFGTLPA